MTNSPGDEKRPSPKPATAPRYPVVLRTRFSRRHIAFFVKAYRLYGYDSVSTYIRKRMTEVVVQDLARKNALPPRRPRKAS